MGNKKPIDDFSKEECQEWLRSLGLSFTDNKEGLRIRIRKYARYPKLVAKLKAKATGNFQFNCSLETTLIPPLTVRWKADENMYPKVTNKWFSEFISNKKEGSKGQ